MNKLERTYMDAVQRIGCLICGNPAQVHHINSGGRRIGHFFTLPLCPDHHEGNVLSIGNTKKTFIRKFGSEIYLMLKLRTAMRIIYGSIFQKVFDIQDLVIEETNLRSIEPEGNND